MGSRSTQTSAGIDEKSSSMELESEFGEDTPTILVAGADPRVHQALSASIMAV